MAKVQLRRHQIEALGKMKNAAKWTRERRERGVSDGDPD